MEQDSIEEIAFFASQHLSLPIQAYKRRFLHRRIHTLVEKSGLTPETFQQKLYADTFFQEKFRTDLFIGATLFFRDPYVFDRLKEFLSEMATTKIGNGKPLRAWSAGCSTGEEPISAAILILEALQQANLPIQIYGTDIDQNAISKAISGFYSPAQLALFPDTYKSRYFIAHDTCYEINKKLRDVLFYSQHDLSQKPPFLELDLVICRNVLIYFDEPLQIKCAEYFKKVLVKGGYLLLGQSELLNPQVHGFKVVDSKCNLYQKES